jgi:uncharacterized coiled-coil protein SlyX
VVINYLFFPKELTILFQSIYNAELTQIDLTNILNTNRGTRINKKDYLERIKNIGEELGISQNIKTHSFRKYFSSQIRRLRDLDMEFKEHLMGHKGQNLSQSYNNNLRDVEWYYNQWCKIENAICIECEIVDKTNKEIADLRVKLAKKDDQIEYLSKKMARLEVNVDKLTTGVAKIIEDKIKETLGQ